MALDRRLTPYGVPALQALRAAIDQVQGGDPLVALYIYRGATRDHLVYRVEMPRVGGDAAPSAHVFFVDAHTGETVNQYDNLQTGSGSSLYSGTVTIDTSSTGGTFYMEDLTRRLGTFNMNNTGSTTMLSGLASPRPDVILM